MYNISDNFTSPIDKINIQNRISCFFEYYRNLKPNNRNQNEIFSKTPKKNFKSKDLDYCISTSKTFATSTEYLSYKYSIFSNDSYKNNSISNTNYLEFNQNFEKICLEREKV